VAGFGGSGVDASGSATREIMIGLWFAKTKKCNRFQTNRPYNTPARKIITKAFGVEIA
jgi:hypothetical protein